MEATPMQQMKICSAAALIFVTLASAASAQTYPARPIRMLCPIAPGGGLDVIARSITPALSENLKTSVVVDNRPGASGAIAMEVTARAAPDGYTFVIMSVTALIYPELNKAPYDVVRDFAAVTQVSASPYVLAVHPSLPATLAAVSYTHLRAHET
jgi:tripartite-type tricarboxylate transporter receptor subunit TctC